MLLKSFTPLFAGLALAALAASPVLAEPSPPITAAVADAGRPAADKARDAARHPAEILEFAQVKPGGTVTELLPGGGYFTRILAKAVGPKGVVQAAVPSAPAQAQYAAGAKAIAAEPGYSNVKVVGIEPAGMAAAAQADVLFTAQNYHDFHLTMLKVDVPATNKMLFAAVKPGGVLILIDHTAKAGAPVTETADGLHRIDPAVARKELEAAGFVYEAESKVLANPADPLTANVFDPSIRGKTDQFAYRFRKPK